MRTPLLAGNWKMYKTPAETQNFFDAFLPMVRDVKERQIAICPPYIDLATAIAAAKGTNVGIGAQNLAIGKEGAMTGEISGHMLKTIGCRYVIIGHSERRQFFGETDAGVLSKTLAALEFGLTPIVCVGELLAQREAGETEAVLDTQFEAGLAALSPDQFASIVIAYEPVWAIGTGKVATPEQAAEAHAFIRGRVALRFGNDQAQAIRILYGGSVKPDNVSGLMAKGDIDGALVGGASLDPKSFAAIVNFAE
ncbi:MAG TPA: triose-phosphate isomerase [Caulobacterales bacterium]|nr:triose-phosphate isomerase [Caulobacterales bacterium]